MIRFSQATKTYPNTGDALSEVTLHVQKGEFAFLTGHSGSGKSTLLKLVYGEERLTSGELRVSGFRVDRLSRRDVSKMRRRIGVIFQDFRLLTDRTVEQNVAFALEVIGAKRASITPRVMRVLTQVGLAAKASANPQELSGGEQQRVAIARALVNSPMVLLADEPTGNLDERASRGVVQLLREINASGTAILLATHDMEVVRRNDYRVVELHSGSVVFDSATVTGQASA